MSTSLVLMIWRDSKLVPISSPRFCVAPFSIPQSIQLNSNMGHTKQSQKITRGELDEKLSLSIPSRELLEELAVKCAEDPTPDKTFQYAFCLSKSRQESELRYAVTILDSLVKEGYEHQIDCMIGSATALYLLGEFEEGQ